jgi:hypothetical protein
MDCVRLLPRGLGVRQPYAAFVAATGARFPNRWPNAALGEFRFLCEAAKLCALTFAGLMAR